MLLNVCVLSGLFLVPTIVDAHDLNGNINIHNERKRSRSREPIVIVPQNFMGTVEVYETSQGYMVRTKQEENDTYGKIHNMLDQEFLRKQQVQQNSEQNN